MTKKTYEAMFLVDSAQAGSDWDGTLAAVNRVLERAGAEVLALRKWSDRKLAYEIDHKSRGTYILSFFKAEGAKIAGLEKDVQLSEQIMRVLVLGTEDRPPDVVDKDISGETQAPQDAEDDRQSDDNDDDENGDDGDTEMEPSDRGKHDIEEKKDVEGVSEDESMESSEAKP